MRKVLFVITMVLTLFAFASPEGPPQTDIPDYLFVQPDAVLAKAKEYYPVERLLFTNHIRDVFVVQSPHFEVADSFIGINDNDLNESVFEGTLKYILQRPVNESSGERGANFSPPRADSGLYQTDIVLLC